MMNLSESTSQDQFETMFDVVGFLPLELLAHVVEYLDLEDIVRYQMVSKKWREKFSCETIILPFLRETLKFLDLDQAGVSMDEAIADAMSYFRWRHGLQHARPVKKIFLTWSELGKVSAEPFGIQHHSRQLCYGIPHDNRRDFPNNMEVEILSLETGDKSVWTVSETESIDHFVLSDRYLVMRSRRSGPAGPLNLDDEWFLAWNLQERTKLEKRTTPGEKLEICTIVEDKVIIMCKPDARRPDSVYVWNLSSNDIYKIGFNHLIDICHVHENTLVAFETIGNSNPPEVHQSSWTTTGQFLEKKVIHLPLSIKPPLKGPDTDSAHFQTYGCRTIANTFWSDNDVSAGFYLEYDHTIDKLSVRSVRCAEPLREMNDQTISMRLTRDIVYRFSKKDGHIAIYDTAAGTVTKHPGLT